MNNDQTSNMSLFRGDSKQIKRFSMQRVANNSLVGKGIYLTNSIEVAHSYRGKADKKANYKKNSIGRIVHSSSNLYISRESRTKEAFVEFVRQHHQAQTKTGTKVPEQHTKEWAKLVQEVKPVWNLLLNDKHPSLELTEGFLSRRSRAFVTSHWESLIIKEREPGYITQFDFDRKDFESKMLDVSMPITDRRVLKVLYYGDYGYRNPLKEYPFHKFCKDMETSFISDGCNVEHMAKLEKSHGKQNIHKRNIILLYENMFVKDLKALGYKGFEYSGGSYTSGVDLHRAFSVWDEDYVNRHMVSQFK